MIIICGEEDKDCLPQCKLLEVKALDMGLNINSIYIEKIGHDYPEMFNEIVQQFIKWMIKEFGELQRSDLIEKGSSFISKV